MSLQSARVNVLDYIIASLAPIIGYLGKRYHQCGAVNMPRSRRAFRQAGIYPIPRHYYFPLFHDGDFDRNQERQLPGIDLRANEQIAFLNKLVYVDEVVQLGMERSSASPLHFRLGNGLFESGDAEFLYQFIRSIKPHKVIEIGGGYSTKLVSMAMLKNCSEDLTSMSHTVIEPYEQPWLDALDIDLVRDPVQSCSIDYFKSLSSGDLLFIDSSHMIRRGGDVLYEYLEVLPTLQSGVYVHVHDIFTPSDYPKSWTQEHILFWNEQYLLEAMLSNSSRYRVVAGLNFLKAHFYNDLRRVCPYLTQDREPGSFYFQVV